MAPAAATLLSLLLLLTLPDAASAGDLLPNAAADAPALLASHAADLARLSRSTSSLRSLELLAARSRRSVRAARRFPNGTVEWPSGFRRAEGGAEPMSAASPRAGGQPQVLHGAPPLRAALQSMGDIPEALVRAAIVAGGARRLGSVSQVNATYTVGSHAAKT